MKTGITKYYILAAMALAIVMSACNTNGCTDNQSSIPLAGFYSMSSKAKVSLDSVSIYGVGVKGDSMMVRNGVGITQVYMPLNLESNTTRYVVHYNQKAISDPLYNDTISISYEPVPYFVSSECGAMYFYDMRGAAHTRHFVDSVAITTDRITNRDIETVQIYFRVAEKTESVE